jgi:DNA repair protein RecO (recombination protein O)
LLLAKGRDMDIITQAETVNAYRPLREDLLRGAYAAYAVELLDRFMPDAQENAEIYALLRHMLAWVCVSTDLALSARYYELQLLSLAGFQPELRQCVAGGEKIVAEDQFFSPEAGGVMCPRCGGTQSNVVAISLSALKLLRYFQANDYAKVMAIRVRSVVHAELERVMLLYITHILERQLKSVEFLKLIRREASLTPSSSA